MKEGLIKDALELILKEIQTLSTICYVISVGVGMLFNHYKYSRFSINIFEYSDILDFLIVPFSDIYILGFAFASTCFIAGVFFLDSLVGKKWPKFYSLVNFGRDKKYWFKTYKVLVFVSCLVYYLVLSAKYYGSFTEKKILAQKEITITLVNKEIQRGICIGKTKDVIFMYRDKATYVIPIHSLVKEIRIR